MQSFLSAHLILLNGLIRDAGSFRSGNVGIVKGSKIAYIAPDGSMVKGLMKDLFSNLKNEKGPH